jgi:hypothetical protein
MEKINMSLWGREIELELIYDRFDDEEITPDQSASFQEIKSKPQIFSETKEMVINYCLNNNPEQFSGGRIEDIFQYLTPKSIYIKRSRDNNREFALLCDYKFDPDNGIAVIFKNGELMQVAAQDQIL